MDLSQLMLLCSTNWILVFYFTPTIFIFALNFLLWPDINWLKMDNWLIDCLKTIMFIYCTVGHKCSINTETMCVTSTATKKRWWMLSERRQWYYIFNIIQRFRRSFFSIFLRLLFGKMENAPGKAHCGRTCMHTHMCCWAERRESKFIVYYASLHAIKN